MRPVGIPGGALVQVEQLPSKPVELLEDSVAALPAGLPGALQFWNANKNASEKTNRPACTSKLLFAISWDPPTDSSIFRHGEVWLQGIV